MAERMLQGLPAAPGLAVGTARLARTRVESRERVAVERRPLELRRARDALAAAALELGALAERLESGGRTEEAEIVRTGVLMAEDPSLIADADRAALGGLPAAAALDAACARHADAIAALGDPTLAARADDVRSLGRRAVRLLDAGGTPAADGARALEGVASSGPAASGPTTSSQTRSGPTPSAPTSSGPTPAPASPAAVVLVADELGPADVAELGAEVVAIVLAAGGPTAHAAVVARGLGLPMAVGLGPGLLSAPADEAIVVDGDAGLAVLAPEAARVAAAGAAQRERRADRERARLDRELPAVTRDGHRVRVLVNAATRAELDAGLAAGAEGVGLLRTELAFLDAARWPGEGEHRAAIAPVLAGLAGRTATVRVLDFGADKTPPFLAGTPLRGLELLLAHPDELDAQLRAAVDAGRDCDLRILLPMAESAEQVRVAQAAVARAVAAVRGARAPALGAMIETRTAVAAAPEIAAAADFLSIGTNDLAHAVLGSDRFGGSPAPAHHPRVLAAMAATARAAVGARVVLEVCGEAASEPASVPLLVGLGVGELSVGAARVGVVRRWVRSLRRDGARRAAAAAQRAAGEAEAAALGAELLLEGRDAAGERVERDGRVLAVGPEA
jgi:phosphoenolpyruvate-protein kinase (PTS system EI component)